MSKFEYNATTVMPPMHEREVKAQDEVPPKHKRIGARDNNYQSMHLSARGTNEKANGNDTESYSGKGS